MNLIKLDLKIIIDILKFIEYAYSYISRNFRDDRTSPPENVIDRHPLFFNIFKISFH